MKGKKTGGRNFEPGQSGNPKGRTPLLGDLREARKLNKSEFERIANKFLWCTKEELKDIVDDPSTNALELLAASIMCKAIETGDQARLEFLLNRLIGKVTENMHHTFPKPTIIQRPNGEKVILGVEDEDEESEE